MPFKLVTIFQSGSVEDNTDARLRCGHLDDLGKDLLLKMAAVEEEQRPTLLAHVNELLGSTYTCMDYIPDVKAGIEKSAGIAIVIHGGELHFKVREDAPPNTQRFTGGVFKHTMPPNSIAVMTGAFHKTYDTTFVPGGVFLFHVHSS